MTQEDYGVILFDSSQQAIRAEHVLRDAGFTIKLIPVPRQIHSDCGVCVRFLWAQRTPIQCTLEERDLPLGHWHHLEPATSGTHSNASPHGENG